MVKAEHKRKEDERQQDLYDKSQVGAGGGVR